jgi:hypothetical protein
VTREKTLDIGFDMVFEASLTSANMKEIIYYLLVRRVNLIIYNLIKKKMMNFLLGISLFLYMNYSFNKKIEKRWTH